MKSILLAFAFLLAHSQTTSTRTPVTGFYLTEVPAMEALLKLSQDQDMPLGIVQDDDQLCKTRVTYSARNSNIRDTIEGILGQVPGYHISDQGSSEIIIVSPKKERPESVAFLNKVDKKYGPISANVQTLAMMLWLYIYASLHPANGTAGSILSSPDDRMYSVDVANQNVEQILNKIATLSRGTWILRPLPTPLTSIDSNLPFSIYSRYGRTDTRTGLDLCRGQKSGIQDK